MAWFDAALADERAAFWSAIVSHDALGRLLSCELTRPEYLRLFADLRYYDQRMPAVMRRAGNKCQEPGADLRAWLLARADEHAAWSTMWPSSFRVSAIDGTRLEITPSAAARHLCDNLSGQVEPEHLLGALTVVCWFEVVVAGALRDILGAYYGVAPFELALLEGRAGGPRHDLKVMESVLGQISTEAARRACCDGLRLPLPFLAAVLSASGDPFIDMVPVQAKSVRRSDAHPVFEAPISASRLNAAVGQ